MNRKIKTLIAVGAVVLTVALVFGGVALARSQDSTGLNRLNSYEEYCRGPGWGPGLGGGNVIFDDALTNLLGMTQDEIQAQLRKGNSLVEIAATKNIDEQTLVNTLVDSVKNKLQEAVANQDITQKVADSILQKSQDNIAKMVNNKLESNKQRGPAAGPFGGSRPGFDGRGSRGMMRGPLTRGHC